MQISNVSAMEVNLVRPFVRRALEAFYKHDKPEADVDRDTRSSNRQPREANNEPRVKLFTLPTHFLFPFKRGHIQTSTLVLAETSKATLRSFYVLASEARRSQVSFVAIFVELLMK